MNQGGPSEKSKDMDQGRETKKSDPSNTHDKQLQRTGSVIKEGDNNGDEKTNGKRLFMIIGMIISGICCLGILVTIISSYLKNNKQKEAQDNESGGPDQEETDHKNQ